ncbi:preprotein translocase subunit SecF [Lysobacter concretionis Ko07 = DSM 16239]|jgi:preprotein translocase subunit SecF|uniref:Protein-export membrane protein SecF n=1 Tax=Lysobacter concretionis Ko07 = DSM 16239 TaxID=1122185 RepID=A0A0A0ELD9_9GAMM|nr:MULTISPECIES: protein translocase subunit SecF [Lysobacter]KGM50943.1 preprotein translocase subunit SecF [Lysobacter concretionis Ko07 = DSM 16239]QOD90367.1 protein translocase subunit SecF [Lysobacter sp. CW239]
MKQLNIFPHDVNFNFLRLRGVAFTMSVLLILTSIGAVAFNGFNFALDFTGGTVTELRFDKPVDIDDARARLAEAGYGGAEVLSFGSGNDLLVRLQSEEEGGDAAADANSRTAQAITAAVSTPDNPGQVMRSDFVGPQVGKELALNGIWAVIFVVVGFLLYISMRFEKKFAIAAVIASLQDVTIVTGWFALSGHEFDLTVLAGILSVLGFSINDTIVVFDRIRDNFRTMRADPETIINTSINQTLSRTVITSVVAFLTVLALYLYGGGSLRGMAESQMIGVVIGTLSSIFVAAPLLTLGFLKVTKQDLMPKARNEEALARRP